MSAGRPDPDRMTRLLRLRPVLVRASARGTDTDTLESAAVGSHRTRKSLPHQLENVFGQSALHSRTIDAKASTSRVVSCLAAARVRRPRDGQVPGTALDLFLSELNTSLAVVSLIHSVRSLVYHLDCSF